MSTFSLDVGAVHADLLNATCSGSASVNAPLVRCAGLGATVSDASPAVEMTLAVVLASYVLSTPGVNGPNEAGAPRDSDSVAGTEPPTVPSAGGEVISVMPLPSNCTQLISVVLLDVTVRNSSLRPSIFGSGNVAVRHVSCVPMASRLNEATTGPVWEPVRSCTVFSAEPAVRAPWS